eukprot:15441991-Alexandrium_andersonii.AAC.1
MSLPGWLSPPGPPEKCFRRARRPVSSADSASAQATMQKAPLGSFGDKFCGRFKARAVQASNVSSTLAFSRIGELPGALWSSGELRGAPGSARKLRRVWGLPSPELHRLEQYPHTPSAPDVRRLRLQGLTSRESGNLREPEPSPGGAAPSAMPPAQRRKQRGAGVLG